MRENFKNELLRIVHNWAEVNQFTISSHLESELAFFINRGVDNMTLEEYSSTNMRAQARVNTVTLITLISIEIKNKKLDESLQYSAFNTVKGSVCPLWPFC